LVYNEKNLCEILKNFLRKFFPFVGSNLPKMDIPFPRVGSLGILRGLRFSVEKIKLVFHIDFINPQKERKAKCSEKE